MTNSLSFAELLGHHPRQSARELMGADTGTLYLLRHEKGQDRLECAAVQPVPGGYLTAIAIDHPAIRPSRPGWC